MFGPNGGLVANAPHIPVHLGAMQEAVQYQVGMSLLIIYFTGTFISIGGKNMVSVCMITLFYKLCVGFLAVMHSWFIC